MPTDLEIIEAEAAANGDRRPEPRNRAGLFALFIVAFLALIAVSAIFTERDDYAPWITHPDGRAVSASVHPHLRGTRFEIAHPYGKVRDDLFAPLHLSPTAGLSLVGRPVLLGLLGFNALGKVPVILGATNEATILVRRDGTTSSIALLTSATNGASQLLVIDHQPDPARPHHTLTLTADEHLYPGIRGAGLTASGSAMNLGARVFESTDPLASVLAYFHAEFAPVPPTPETTSAALLLSPGDTTNASHLSLFLQTSQGPKFIYAAADTNAGHTRIVLVEFNR